MIPSLRTARFLRAYLAGGAGPFREEEVRLEVEGEPREATLYLPRRRTPAPGWVVLHGMTVPGRRHIAMTRFVRSLAASGAAVLVPDIPAWRTLRVDTAAARETLAAGARFLAERPEVSGGGVGAVGFSFGATQAVIAASTLPEEIRAVVGFGGYCDLPRMVRSLFTGRHEWEGVEHRLDPDPYGRWILAGNYLTRIPGMEGMGAVQRHALALALESGNRGTWAWEAEYDAFKADVRRGLSAAEREVWDAVAPPSGSPPADTPYVRALADGLATAIRDAAPELDPRLCLDGLSARIVLSHGRADRLIPWTETLRLHRLLAPSVDVSATVTGLFAHSAHAGWMHPLERARETGRFVRLLNEALGAV